MRVLADSTEKYSTENGPDISFSLDTKRYVFYDSDNIPGLKVYIMCITRNNQDTTEAIVNFNFKDETYQIINIYRHPRNKIYDEFSETKMNEPESISKIKNTTIWKVCQTILDM